MLPLPPKFQPELHCRYRCPSFPAYTQLMRIRLRVNLHLSHTITETSGSMQQRWWTTALDCSHKLILICHFRYPSRLSKVNFMWGSQHMSIMSLRTINVWLKQCWNWSSESQKPAHSSETTQQTPHKGLYIQVPYNASKAQSYSKINFLDT